jgi:hypothetical protein
MNVPRLVEDGGVGVEAVGVFAHNRVKIGALTS